MSLAKAMIRQGAEHEFLILLNKGLPAEHEIRHQFCGILPQHQILAFKIPPGVAEIHDNVTQTRLAELIRERFIADLQPDVVHISSLIEGLGEDVVSSVGEIFPASRTAVTLYDLIPLIDKEGYLTNRVLSNHYLRKIEHMRKASMLFAISDYSRHEAIDFGGFPSERVVDISSAVDDMFRPRAVSEERRQTLFKRCGIRRDFLMFTGSFDSRKNHPRLIEAFGRLPVEVRSSYQLVIVGRGWNGVYEYLRSVGRSCGLTNDDIVFPGHIGDEDLLDLYNLCTLFVFPSLREGFGLPVLEAMSCGVPTIGSNTTSIPEVLGRKDSMFDPMDVSSISGKIFQALTSQGYLDELRAHALAQAKNFSWDISARKALKFIEATITTPFSSSTPDKTMEAEYGVQTYRKLISQTARIPGITHLADNFLLASADALSANETVANLSSMSADNSFMSVGWVTTWNTRCGIASYTQHLLENLSCTSKIFAPVEPETLKPDGAEVERCWTAGVDDLSSLNEAINRSNVDVLAIQMNYGFFDFPSLSRLISNQKHLGRMVTITLHATEDPPPHILKRRLSDFVPALHSCDAVLVHSLSDIANLKKIGVTENVVLFPQGVIASHSAPSPQQRQRKVFTLGTYGFALPHKGLEQVIAAVARLRENGIEINLEMINAEYPAPVSAELIRNCRALIEKFGLHEHVNMVTEYLDEQDSLQRLANTDLVVFAYQETGESSSAAVRMALAAGTLVAVTPLPIFNDVNELVFTLPGITPEHLAQGIQSAMTMIGSEKRELSVLLENSKRWVENHHFRHLAHYFCHLISLKTPAHAEDFVAT